MALLKLENIVTKFGKRIILDNVSLNFEKGSITALTGKSGAGKTTLLGILSGLMKPNEGKVLYSGKNIFTWGDIRRSRFRNHKIGFVFQFFNLLSDMTSYQNIVYPSRISPFHNKTDTDEMARELIEYLGIQEIVSNYPTTLSGGERQRVAIARAIINKPEIILADEPTGNLDDNSARGIIRLFKRLRNEYNMCLVVVTHDQRIVEMADSHYHLEGGVFKKIPKGARSRIVCEADNDLPPLGQKSLKLDNTKKAKAAKAGKTVQKKIKSKSKARPRRK